MMGILCPLCNLETKHSIQSKKNIFTCPECEWFGDLANASQTFSDRLRREFSLHNRGGKLTEEQMEVLKQDTLRLKNEL